MHTHHFVLLAHYCCKSSLFRKEVCVCVSGCVFMQMQTSCSSLPPCTFMTFLQVTYFSILNASECFVSQMKAPHHSLMLLTLIFAIIFVTSASVGAFPMALLPNMLCRFVHFVCDMDLSRLACCCFSSSVYYATKEHTVHKLLQFLVSQYNLHGLFAMPKISQSQFETSTVFLYF